MFSDVPVKYVGCTHRALKPSQTIEKVEKKLKKAGVSRITDITHLDRVGIPVYSAIRPTAQEGAVSIYAGKGATPIQAKASAMMEAFERYSAEKIGEHQSKIIKGDFEKLDNCINPQSLILPQNSIRMIEKDLEWVEAVDIKSEEKYLVPANAVYHPYYSEKSALLFKSNTNGLASGNLIEEAVFHGITEVIERDAWSIFEVNRCQKTEIKCEESDNEIINGLLAKFNDAQINIKIIDLTADIKVTTIAAVADDPVLKDPALLTMGVGTHLDPKIAVIRALTEVAQSRATQIHGTREDTVRAVFMRKAGYDRMKRINKHWFGEMDKQVHLEDLKNKSSSSFKKDINTSLKEIERCGIEKVLFVDLTRENIKIPVVRVIIPGMEVFSVDSDRVGDRLKKSII
ncbi:YcaO-related McrA-glycine thioamidation protein [Methanobacterium alcaliphilum]|uniref:YcaO-related McrA-glycine thioamidation protein n=1 Tax=Methanobacterium alcaliphilum TaxID=392018 RepID=UPI00200B4E59|nr:YcaO-related McrA-glycine thioamidation protein [Methanobacterium alcaliphilum]MCK9150346.1 YcaO-related McrA-glycine thioamidation protein [Methanobacterium alcaliphilum]